MEDGGRTAGGENSARGAEECRTAGGRREERTACCNSMLTTTQRSIVGSFSGVRRHRHPPRRRCRPAGRRPRAGRAGRRLRAGKTPPLPCVFPLPTWRLRHCLCHLSPLPTWAKTAPLAFVSTAFAAKNTAFPLWSGRSGRCSGCRAFCSATSAGRALENARRATCATKEMTCW